MEVLAELLLEDQMAIREQIEEGLEAKRKLDLLRASLRSMPAVDIDALIEGKSGVIAKLPSRLEHSMLLTGCVDAK